MGETPSLQAADAPLVPVPAAASRNERSSRVAGTLGAMENFAKEELEYVVGYRCHRADHPTSPFDLAFHCFDSRLLIVVLHHSSSRDRGSLGISGSANFLLLVAAMSDDGRF